MIPYQENLAPLIAVGADPATRIISFTVTEAGYYLDADNRLDWASFPDLRADLEAVKLGLAGHTIYGGRVSILRARMKAGAGPVTLMNCDNLRHNGERSRGGLLQFIDSLGDTALKAWVQEHTRSPNIGECFGRGTATFMILGDICTRRCPFCDVGHGQPLPPNPDEPRELAESVAALKLR